MTLQELEELKEFNELDMLYKIIDKAQSIKKRVEKITKGEKGNKSAGVDVRKAMQDIRLMSEIIRDEVQRRKFQNEPIESSRLHKAITDEKKRLEREEKRIKQIEEKRIAQR